MTALDKTDKHKVHEATEQIIMFKWGYLSHSMVSAIVEGFEALMQNYKKDLLHKNSGD